jgi:cell wall assembly regulator SMI1
MTVTATLARIEQWLETHAPVTRGYLNPPATEADLDQAEAVTGLHLLPAVRQLYLWHNGSGGPARPVWLAPDFSFMSLADALQHWTMWRDITAGEPDSPYLQWFPIADAFTGDYLAVDHHADLAGSVVPILMGDRARRDQAWPSLEALAENLLGCLENSQPLRYREWLVTDQGELAWES